MPTRKTLSFHLLQTHFRVPNFYLLGFAHFFLTLTFAKNTVDNSAVMCYYLDFDSKHDIKQPTTIEGQMVAGVIV